MNKLKVFELFAGIGANSKALKNLGVDFEIVGYSEIDKWASKSFSAVHGVSEELNFGDITKLGKLPVKVDILTGGFPCQPFSVAGKGLGINDSRGILAVDMLRIVRLNRPRIVVAENVKGLQSKKHKPLLDMYIEEMEAMGYNCQYKVLNATDFGIPQKRERIFIVSSLSNFNMDNMELTPTRNLNEFVQFTNELSSMVNINQATTKGYVELDTPGVANLSFPNSNTRRGRVIDRGKITPTILTSSELYAVELSDKMKCYINSSHTPVSGNKFIVGKKKE